MTTKAEPLNPICHFCAELNYAYRNIDGKCTYTAISKESNPGGKLPECQEKE